jgi:translocation and assembly module TamB
MLEKSGRVLVERLFADNRGSAIEITGHLDLFDGGFAGFISDMPAELTAVLKDVEISDFFPDIDLAGKFNGRLFLADRITSPRARLSLAASDLGIGEIRMGDLETELTLSEGTLAITEMVLENRRSNLRLTGKTDLFAPGSLSLLPALKLDLVFPESNLYINDFIEMAEGQITIQGHAVGELNDLKAQLFITGSDLEAAGNAIGSLTATAEFENGRLSVEPLKIVNVNSEILVSAGIDLFHPSTFDMYQDPSIEAEITGDAIHIENFISDMAGQLTVSAIINGSVHDLHGSIKISGERIDLGVQKIESLQLTSVIKNNTLFIDPARISLAEGEAIRVQGHVSLDRGYALEIDSDAIRLDRIGVLEDIGLSGAMTLAASGAGNFKDPALQGKVSLSDLTMNRNRLEPITVEFKVDDQVASATATSNFIVASRFHLDSRAFAINGEFDDTLLDPFLHPFGLTGITGNMTADFNAKGNIDNLAQATADLNIAQLVLFQATNGAEPIELVRMERLTATYEDGTFLIPENKIVLVETSRIAIVGKGRLDGEFDFSARGVIPLLVAGVFIPELDNPQGQIDFSARVHQANGQPDYDIDIRLRDLGFTVPELMQNLHQMNGRIHVAGGAISIENIQGMLDTGGFTVSGTIELDEGLNPGQADISLSTRALPINIPGVMDASINSQMRFAGTPENAALSGQVVLLDGLYYRDVEINLIGEVTRRRRAAPTAAEPTDIDVPYLKNLALDIDISYRQPLMVDNNIALMTLRPEIRIIGTLAQPGVTGRAEVGQGTVSYQNIEFNIDRGIIDFIDPYRVQPEIDIRAISQVRHWTITLEVTGTPDDLEFLLTSNPPEEHADILSLIILGQTTREMAEGTGPAGPSPEEMLVNMLAGRFEEDIRAGTGLDIVEFEYTRPGVTEDDQTVRVTVGKELSRRLTITYGVERKGGETVQQHTAIYRLLEFLSMSAFQDTGGTFGGEMQFRLEFR